MEAERHLSAALGGKGHTRRFVTGLFAPGPHRHSAGARVSLAGH
jgi:hypothetical protein